MTVERYVRILAGTFVLLSLALGVEGSPIFWSPWALAFTAFVGLNLFQSGFTNFCPPAILLRKLGVPETQAGCGTKSHGCSGKQAHGCCGAEGKDGSASKSKSCCCH